MAPVNSVEPEMASPESSAPSGPKFQIVFDPFRFGSALLERWLWIVVGGILGLIPLLGLGLLRVKDKYVAQARLIRRESPSSFRAGEIGEAYVPKPPSSATLVSSALSDNVLSRVAAKSEPPISLGMLRLAVQAQEIRGTDFLQLTVQGTKSAQATSDLANLWAQEIVDFTKELQARESREVVAYLRQQLQQTDADIGRVNQQILDFSRKEDLVDAEKQTEVFLRQSAELQIQYENARIDLQTLDMKMKALESELSKYGLPNDRLSAAKAELNEALAKYTEQNPIVQNLKIKVESIEAELSNRPEGLALSDFATTAVGGDLYLELIDLRARRQGAEKNLEALDQLRQEVRRKLEELPDKVSTLAKMRLEQRSLEVAKQLLTARLREATVFAESAPGYYRIFSASTSQSVSATSRYVKVAIAAVVGLILGSGLGFVAVVAGEALDQRLRTALEAKMIFQCPVLAELGPEADAAPVAASLWITWASPAFRKKSPAVFWAPLPDASELALWSALLEEARRLLPELAVMDLGTSPCPALARARRVEPAKLTLAEAEKLAASLHGGTNWVRLSGDPVEPSLTLARLSGGAALIISADRAKIQEWQRIARLLQEANVPILGIVVTGVRPWWNRKGKKASSR